MVPKHGQGFMLVSVHKTPVFRYDNVYYLKQSFQDQVRLGTSKLKKVKQIQKQIHKAEQKPQAG